MKLIDENGNIYSTSLDDNGNELDYDALVKEEARIAKYGKFSPDFYDELLKEKEDKPVKTLIVLENAKR